MDKTAKLIKAAVAVWGEKAATLPFLTKQFATKLDSHNIIYRCYLLWLTQQKHHEAKYANVATSNYYINKYVEQHMERCTDVQNTLLEDTRLVATRMKMGRQLKAILGDEKLDISPVFRYVCGARFGYLDITYKWFERAVWQIYNNEAFLTCIPEDFVPYMPITKEEV